MSLMNSYEKYLSLRDAFETQQDKQKAAKMAAYMKDWFKFYGIAAPERKALYKGILKQEKSGKIIDWKLLDTCYEDEHREFQYFVCDYLSELKKYLTFEDICKIRKYIEKKQWWDTIDCFDRIIGDIGLRDDRVNELMLKWSESDDMWLRRIAIDHQLCRKEKTDTELLKKILINNLGSYEFFINKAIGWSLRDYSKTNPQWVRNFIEEHKERLSPLSIREGSKYI